MKHTQITTCIQQLQNIYLSGVGACGFQCCLNMLHIKLLLQNGTSFVRFSYMYSIDYCNDSFRFSDRQVWANSVDPDHTAP